MVVSRLVVDRAFITVAFFTQPRAPRGFLHCLHHPFHLLIFYRGIKRQCPRPVGCRFGKSEIRAVGRGDLKIDIKVMDKGIVDASLQILQCDASPKPAHPRHRLILCAGDQNNLSIVVAHPRPGPFPPAPPVPKSGGLSYHIYTRYPDISFTYSQYF